jgi:membrane complex biogenesis BtpA family protein
MRRADPLQFDVDLPLLVGVVHLVPLPGAPAYGGSITDVLDAAERDARALRSGGADALIVENSGDAPFFATDVPPETIAALALAIARVRGVEPDAPVGVNVLRNDARAALGLCAATGASFVRVNVHCGAAVTDQGLVVGEAAATVRERARLAPWVQILADVHVKHAQPLAGGSLADAARDTFRRGRADALIVSGRATGQGTEAADVECVRDAVPEAPVLVGSGLDLSNAPLHARRASGAIVGTALKFAGDVSAPVDAQRVRALRAAFRRPADALR